MHIIAVCNYMSRKQLTIYKIEMKNQLMIILVIFVIESQCGLVDNIVGTVKDTTSAVKQDIGGLWSYGSGLLFGHGKNANITETKSSDEGRGFINGVYDSVHDKVHSLRQRINNVFKDDNNPSDKGLVGNMFDKVKNKVLKVKGFILGDDVKDKPLQVNNLNNPLSDETKVVRDGLKKLFFNNGTRKVHGQFFRDAVGILRKKLADIRNNVTEASEDIGNIEPDKKLDEGEGLIDVRSLLINGVDDHANKIKNDNKI